MNLNLSIRILVKKLSKNPIDDIVKFRLKILLNVALNESQKSDVGAIPNFVLSNGIIL